MKRKINKIHLHKKFRLLFEALDSKSVSYILLKGGRNAMKSHAISVFASWYLQKKGNLIYSRYTKSAVSSTIFKDLEAIVKQSGDPAFHLTKNYVSYRVDKETINELIFKGLKASSNDQDANNKGINAYKVAILDEAQDLLDYDEFQRFNLSVRSSDETTEAKMILAFNPTDVSHWIYKKFYEDKVDEGFNGVIGNVAYIDVTYLDALEMGIKVDIKVLDEADELKEYDINKFNNIFLGHWATHSDTIIFNRKDLTFKKFSEFPTDYEMTMAYLDIADQGDDYLCCVSIGCRNGLAYVFDVLYTQKGINETLPKVVAKIRNNNYYVFRGEANGSGQGYMFNVRDKIGDSVDTIIQPITNTTNKMIRIETSSIGIKSKFVFRSDLNKSDEDDRDYILFLEHLCKLRKDKKNQIDDSGDALAGVQRMFKSIYLKQS